MTEVAPPAAPPAGRTGLRRGAVLAVQLALTALVTWFILDRAGLTLADLGTLDPARWRPSWGLLAASSLLLFGGYVLSGLLWGSMVRDMGGGRLRWGTAVRIYFVSNLGRYVPGKLWQIAGLAVLARQKGVSARVATGAAVVGQGVSLAAATLLGAPAILNAAPEYRTVGTWALAAVVALGLLALLPPVLGRLMALWFRLAREEPPEGVDAGPLFVLRWLGLYLLNWGLYAGSFWVLVRSFDLPGSPAQVAPAFAAAYVVGYAALFAPAGIGVREGALTVLLGPLVGASVAAGLAVIARLWTTAVEVVPAGAFWLRHLALREPPVGAEDASARGEPRP